MSESSPAEPTRGPAATASTTDSETSKGFRKFWKFDKKEASQGVTFVQQDPSVSSRMNRISRLLRQEKKSTSGDEESQGKDRKNDVQKRRQQVYQAQKRHRNRQAEYVESLEKEVARLQKLDAIVSSEKNRIAHENQAIKDLLVQQPIDVQLDSLGFSNDDALTLDHDSLSPLGGATVQVRWDQDIQRDRTYLDLDDMEWTTSDVSASGNEARSPRRLDRHAPVKGDTCAALEFILALEWPCQAHSPHDGINPAGSAFWACKSGEENVYGHALTTTNAVYQSAVPARHDHLLSTGAEALATQKWHLPHSEIDKLVALSELLPLGEDSLTPAQAYSAIRETVPGDDWLKPTLVALKAPLAALAACNGFGTYLPVDKFWESVDTVIETLRTTHPS